MKYSSQHLRNHGKKRLTLATTFVLSAMALTACGGGGSDSPTPTPKPPSTVSTYDLQGKVVDIYGNGVPNITIKLYLDREYIETTDANGVYSIKLPKKYRYPEYFAGVATKDGYVPVTIIFDMRDNKPTIKNTTVPIRVREESDILFPASLQVKHLGDSSYEGTENSQFQFPNAHGKEWSTTATLTATQKSKYNQLCIEGSFKGVQRPNKIILSNGSSTEVTTTSDTDPLGGYSELESCMSIDKFKANQKLTLTLKSVATGSSNDIDDFEFVNLRGVLKNSTDSHAESYNLTGTIINFADQQPESGFKVSVVVDGKEYSALTNSLGKYTLHLPKKGVTYPEYFAGVATKSGRLPITLIFETKNSIPTLVDNDITLQSYDINANNISIDDSQRVIHLGDSSYTGTVNSKFQYANAEGTRWQGKFRLSNEQKNTNRQLGIFGFFKGVQDVNKKNMIYLSSDANLNNVLQSSELESSDSSGKYSTAGYAFEVSKLPANKDIYVTIVSGSDGNDHDDFEFTNLTIKLD